MNINTSDVNKISIDSLILKEIDSSVVNWFSKGFSIDFDGRKVPVIFVSQERWSLMQRQRGLRDDNGVLILPIISVRRLETTELYERYVPKTDGTRVIIDKRIATQSYNDKEPLPFFSNKKLN